VYMMKCLIVAPPFEPLHNTIRMEAELAVRILLHAPIMSCLFRNACNIILDERMLKLPIEVPAYYQILFQCLSHH